METSSHAETSDQLESLFFTTIPIEIRFLIYDQMLNTRHLIIITPNGPQRGIFKPSLTVCKKLRAEIREWLLGKNDVSIVRSPAFGVLNGELTTFKMSRVDIRYTAGARSQDRYQRCYIPSRAALVLSQLENWQTAMDATNSEYSDQTYRWMAGPTQRPDLLNNKFLSWDLEDWRVLDERVIDDYVVKEVFFRLKELIRERYVWSGDFKSH